MRIVVLDGHALNPGDLSWDELDRMGACTVHDRTPPEKVIERARDADIVLTNKTVLDAETLAALPKLAYIGVLATGYNVVDTDAARARGIPVTHVPAYSTRSVAQLTFALLLELAHRVGHHTRSVREGRWSECADFCFWDYPLIELEGLTMGIVGYGRIGRAVAALATAFGMHVLAHGPAADADEQPKRTDLDTLLRSSDVVSLHCPLTAGTQGMISAGRLAAMKPTALLINTARGPLIDEQALADALNTDRLAGAGLDVLGAEPPGPDNPLLTAKNCLITPHIAWATRAARTRLMQTATENVRAFLEGNPTNVVNG